MKRGRRQIDFKFHSGSEVTKIGFIKGVIYLYTLCYKNRKKKTFHFIRSRIVSSPLGNLQTLTGTVVSDSGIVVSGSGIVVSGSGIIFSDSGIEVSGSGIIFSGSLIVFSGSLIIFSGSIIIFSGYLIISVTLSTLKIGNFLKLGKAFQKSLKFFFSLFTQDRNKMGDSVPLKLALPELKYPIGSQPKEKSAINQYSGSDYISIVKSILKPDEMIRVRGSFLGPVMKLSERGLKLSAKIGRSHKLSDVVDQLRNTREDASEERVCLAMLILVESILLRKSKGGSFPLEYAKNAQDMTYPWGKEAYIVLLKSIQNAVANHLENKSKFELQGYPLVFLLWILESIPLLRNKFSKCVPTVEVPGPTYLCEKYTEIENPSLDRVLQVEADTKLKVHCILPSIPHDPEDDISMEDKYSDELETVKDVTKKGYKITADDWENRCVDTFDTLDALIQMMANKETGQASTPIDEDSVNKKVNRIITRSSGTPLSPMSHTQPSSGTPLSPMSHTQPSSETPLSPMSQQPNLTHEETMIESAASPKSQQNEDYTQSSSETPLSPMSQQPNLTNEDTMNESDDETPALDTQVFSPNLTKEKETETSTGERPSNPNQDGKPDDEIVREKLTSESPATQSQVLQKETVEMNETPSSPIAPKSIETPVYTPSQTQQIEREPSDDTPALDTQVFTPNLTKERETQTSTDETPPKTNQGEGKPDDEIVIESPAAQTQVLQKETLEMNETPSSPISPKSIEAQVFYSNSETAEETYEATQPLTEIISANNKKEDTHAVHYRPSSPSSSLIALVIEENKNALSETETATQYFSTSEGEHSQSSRKNQAEEYLKDTTEPTTELVSTDVSKTQPLTPQTQHLQTSEGDQSDETPSEQNQAEENLKDTTEPTTELVSTYVSKMPPITQQTEHLQTSAIDFSEKNEVEVSRLLAHFQIGAEVEILSTDDEIWYPGKVVDLKLCEGLEELTVEYTTLFTDQHRLQKLQDTITADKIRPATPTSDQKSFEMMDKVEAFYNNGWSSGQISMVLGDNTYSVCLYTSMETILFKHSDLRIHREWKDGVWKMADKVKPDKKRKAAASSQNSGMDNVFLRRSERVPKRSRDTKTPFKSDRNPALTVIPEIIPAVDPFSTPAEHKLSRLQNWMTLKPGMHETSLSINDNKIRKSFFQSMENAKKDLKKEHIDGAFAMLNCRRNENAAWFHNYKIPKACFLPMEFLHCLLSDDLAYKKEKVKGKKIFNDLFKDTVRGKVYPEKTWGEDVDVVYGITLGKKSNVWIGMEIHLKKKRITVYDCFQKESNSIDIPQVKKLAVLISNLLVESSGDEVDKVKMIPFEIEQAQGLPKTKHPFNCGIFLVKILECQSLKIGDMTKINDDNALELRRTLSCEIFNQFDRNKMGDPLPLRLALPELRYPIGSEPEKTISINQHSIVAYIKTVKEILGNDEFNRIRGTFLGPDVEKQLRNTREDASDERFCLAMLLLIESILLRKSLLLDGGTTFTLDYVKIAQDMDVLMTYPWGRTAYNLLLKSLQRAVDKSLDKNNYDLQGFPMAFLIWILESVPLLQYAFSQVVPILSVQPSTPIFLCEKYLQIASPQLIDVLLIEIKDHLKVTCILPPISNDPEDDVCMGDKANKDLDDMADLSKRGYKFKIRDWRNMSVDLYGANEEIRRASLLFGNGGMSQASTSYQEESLESKINRISEMVGDNLRIMNDRLCLIEKDRKQIKERVTNLEKLQRVTSYETPNNETDTTPFHETASRQGEANADQADEQLNNEASIILKTDTREPMNEITKETPGSPIAQQNIETPVLTPIQTQQETHELMNEIISPNISDTQPNTRARRNLLTEQNKDVESRVQNPFEIGANVEISSQDDNTCHKWYPGNVLATYLVDGVEMVKVEYFVPSLDEKKRKRSVETRVSIDRIRPQPPPERSGAKKSYELMQDVEAFDNGAWCAGKVKVI
ncbi:hypothetical protein IGI04_015808 [Brassica rapa subsp. trilocularis]|uniref:Ubiquitin-like protease family profile domain-containing protein n=1 Tax=Brassica rapa subsp. trilocularis TaxID=1813537 RepID=A0ABQ7MTN0_BRACM|nr:hypothetical protein IGI04_015808 [Brassica rapa subsp. trilocularis]